MITEKEFLIWLDKFLDKCPEGDLSPELLDELEDKIEEVDTDKDLMSYLYPENTRPMKGEINTKIIH